MPEPIVFAHPPAVRARGKAALAKHGSLRRASAATGIPKSTLHLWQQNGGFDGLDGIDAEDLPNNGGSMALDQVQTAIDEDQDPTSTSEKIDEEPDGFPETPEAVAGDQEVPSAPPGGWPADPMDGFMIQVASDPADAAWLPDTPQSLQALLRYSNGLLAGARPDYALRAAQVIDPDFGLTEPQHTRLLNSLSNLMMAEVLEFGSTITPPSYVRSVYDAHAVGPQQTQALADELAQQYQSAYLDTINGQLTALGRPALDALPDSLMGKLSDQADSIAQQMAETWNSDLASEVGQQWIALSAQRGTQMSQAWLDDAVSDWETDRSGWKADQWATDAYYQTCAQALDDWQDNNQTVTTVTFEGPDTDEPICAELLDQYGDPTPVDQVDEFGSLPHPGCAHNWATQQHSVPDDQSLWPSD